MISVLFILEFIFEYFSFQINLLTPNGTALHFNPRLPYNHVVRNSKFGDEWGPEDKAGPQPFEKGKSFEVSMACENEKFQIAVNGSFNRLGFFCWFLVF